MVSPLALLLFLVVSAQTHPQCLNHGGEPVDWWFIYKLAKTPGTIPLTRVTNASGKNVKVDKSGFLYAYYDSQMAAEAVKFNRKHSFRPVEFHPSPLISLNC